MYKSEEFLLILQEVTITGLIGIRAKGEVICKLQKVSNKFKISSYRFQNWFYFKLFSVVC